MILNCITSGKRSLWLGAVQEKPGAGKIKMAPRQLVSWRGAIVDISGVLLSA
jgi:hypothetical protein